MPTDQDPAALAPCPFCGGEPRLHKPNGTAYAWCEACRTSPWKLADWNRRAPDPAVLALTEERNALRRTLGSARASIRLVLNRDKISEWTAGALREAETEIDAALRGKEGT